MTTTELGMEDSEDKCSPDNGDGFKEIGVDLMEFL